MQRYFFRVLTSILLAICLIGGFSVISADDNAYAAAKKNEPKSVTLNHKIITLKKGKSIKLKVKVAPKKAAKKAKIIWKSSKKKVVKVDKKGKIKALKAGKATITAAIKGKKKKAKCTIYVGTPASSVTVTSNISLTIGQSKALKASVKPAKAKLKLLTYSSSNSSIVTVSKKGIVTAISAGSADVIVKPLDEAGKSATCKVTVTPSPNSKADKPAPSNDTKKSVIKSIEWDDASVGVKEMTGGTSVKLGVKIQPAQAKCTMNWKSSDEKALKIKADGSVSADAYADGIFTITVTAIDDSGNKKELKKDIKVNPIAKSVSDNNSVKEALKKDSLKTLEIKSNKNIKVEIPEGKHPNVDLVVDAFNGHVENHAVFKSIMVKAVSKSSYVEHANGNNITFSDDDGKLEIAKNASAAIRLENGAGNVNLVADGNITMLRLATKVKLAITGQTANSIPTEIEKEASQSSIQTSVEMDVNTAVKVKLDIRGGAEHTTVSTETKAMTPEITGLGVIVVTYSENDEESHIVAKNDGSGLDQNNVKIDGKIIDSEDKVITDANVALVPYLKESDYSEIEKMTTEKVMSASTDSEGLYNINDVGAGNYYILVTAEGYAPSLGNISIASNTSKEFKVPEIMLVSEEFKQSKGSIHGKIVDAETGKHVPKNLKIIIRQGNNNVSGDIIATTQSYGNGNYDFYDLPFGQYTIQVMDTKRNGQLRYATTSFIANVSKNEQTIKDEPVSAIMSTDQIRFVLTWGKEGTGASSDLDSHLIGPAADGKGTFHTWFGDREYVEYGEKYNGMMFADLDRDDVDYEGPETTTIRIRSKGVYSFYIHDYVNETDNDSNQMAKSAAVIKVFSGKKVLGTFNVPNKPGVLWHVCDYDSRTNKLISKNEIIKWDDGDEANIGLSEEELLKRGRADLEDLIDKAKNICDDLPDGELKEDGRACIFNAEKAKEGTDTREISKKKESLENWMDRTDMVLDVSEVYTGIDPDSDSNTITHWGIQNEWDEDDENILYRVLELHGTENSMPANLTIKFRENGVFSEIKTSDKDEYQKMIVAKYGEKTRTYYIDYSHDDDYSMKIDNVEAYQNEAGESHNLILSWWIDYPIDLEENDYYKLVITGETKSLPDNIAVTAKASDSEVKINKSDKANYQKMLVVTNGKLSRKYYIEYHPDEDHFVGIKNVLAYKNGSDEEDDQITEWSTDGFYDEGGTYKYTLDISGEEKSMPENLKIEANHKDASVEVLAADNDKYEKMAVVTNGDMSKTYYLDYHPDEDYFTGIKNVTARTDSSAEENDLIAYWNAGGTFDREDNYYFVLSISGKSKTLPSTLKIEPSHKDATVELKESNKYGYQKRAVITNGEITRTYYIEYRPDEEHFVGIKDVTTSSVEQENNEIISWQDFCTWDEEGKGHYTLEIIGKEKAFPESLIITAKDKDAKVDVEATDDDEYQGVAVVTNGEMTRKYHIVYRQDPNIKTDEEEPSSDPANDPSDDPVDDPSDKPADNPSDDGDFEGVAGAYDLLNEFRANSENQWYWNENDTEKVKTGTLESLAYDKDLEEIAQLRAKEAWEQYYSNGIATHDRLDGSEWSTAYPSSLKYKAENLAWGQVTAADAITDPDSGWAETNDKYSGQGHRRNMLSSKATHVGIACYVKDGKTCWAMSLGSYQ